MNNYRITNRDENQKYGNDTALICQCNPLGFDSYVPLHQFNVKAHTDKAAGSLGDENGWQLRSMYTHQERQFIEPNARRRDL